MRLVPLLLFGLIIFCVISKADIWSDLAEYKLGETTKPNIISTINEIIVSADPIKMASIEDELLFVIESNSSTLEAKKQSLIFLDRIGTDRSLPVVSKLLGHENLALLSRRILESRRESKAAYEALITELPKVEDSLKIGIIATLAEHAKTSAVPAIVPYISSDNIILAQAAYDAIGRIGGKYAHSAVVEGKVIDALSDHRERAVLDTTDSIDLELLRYYFETSANSSLQIQAFKKLYALDAPQAEKSFKNVFSQSSSYKRQALIRTAMELDVTYQEEFVQTFSNLSIADKLTVLGAISELGLSEYESNLISLLPESRGEIHNQIIYALASIGGEASFQTLYQAFQEDDDNPAITYAITQLELPIVDKYLLGVVSGQSTSDVSERIAAITPLVLRNPDGSSDIFNDLIDPSQIEVLRKAGFKAIASAGDIENCKRLAQLIVSDDVFKRQAQQSLKKAALRINKGNDLWHSTFEPILSSKSSTLRQKESLLVIIDGIPTRESLNYLKKQIMSPSSPLRALAVRMLGRWPKYMAGEVWIELVTSDTSTPEDHKAALRGLTRILTRDEIEKNANRRLDLATRAIEMAPSMNFKIKILECFEDSDEHTRRRMKVHFLPLLDNPELAPIINTLIMNH